MTFFRFCKGLTSRHFFDNIETMFDQKAFTQDFADLIKKYGLKMVDENSFAYTNDDEPVFCGVEYLFKREGQTIYMNEICGDAMDLLNN